jgi:hypothetical protein
MVRSSQNKHKKRLFLPPFILTICEKLSRKPPIQLTWAMNLDLLDEDLPPALSNLIKEVEEYCGFEIKMEHDSFLSARATLVSGPNSMTLKVKQIPVNTAAVAHELCHARRFYNQKVWMMELIPPRYFGTGEQKRNAAENLDNVLEHLVILKEMEDELGFSKDDSQVVEDLNATRMRSEDPFLYKSILLTNWLLSKYHFPNHIARVRKLLAEERLLSVAETLLSEVQAADGSKSKIIAALAKALGIPQNEIRLRRRDPCAGGQDEAAMLSEVLQKESAL